MNTAAPPAPHPEEQTLLEAQRKGGLALVLAYFKLSGPGWLQSALTLGGGSLSSSLYLGVLAGTSLLWLQPVAMVLGIVMLSAIGYVTTSTGASPFQAVNRQVNPVLGWGWALASLLASLVWSMPQYSLATAVVQQNLLPGVVEGWPGKVVVVLLILGVSTAVTWSYGSGRMGVKLYEVILKVAVALIVACFIAVVITLSLSSQGLPWQSLWKGFIPNPQSLLSPSEQYLPLLQSVKEAHRSYWSDLIVQKQTDVLVSAAATAVGINMTFLFPYTLLRRKWGKAFRGFVIFDLGSGMLIPFVIATSCVVIAAATQFHVQPQPGLGPETAEQRMAAASPIQQREFQQLLQGRVAAVQSGATADIHGLLPRRKKAGGHAGDPGRLRPGRLAAAIERSILRQPGLRAGGAGDGLVDHHAADAGLRAGDLRDVKPAGHRMDLSAGNADRGHRGPGTLCLEQGRLLAGHPHLGLRLHPAAVGLPDLPAADEPAQGAGFGDAPGRAPLDLEQFDDPGDRRGWLR